jgi:DNA-binding Xre family transcriptional regulator
MLTGQFETDAKRAAKTLEREMRAMKQAAAKAGAAIGSAIAAAGASFATLTKSAISAADQTRKMAQSVGVSTETMSTLAFAAKQSGVSVEALKSSLSRLSVEAAKAAQGGGAAQEAFRALGVSVTNSDGSLRSSREILGDLAARFAAMPDGVEKTALAVQLFGRAGAQMIPLLNQGADGLEALEERARALGVEISDRTAAQAERFNDTLDELKTLAQGVGLDIADRLLPSINAYTRQIVEAGVETRNTSGAVDVFASAVKGLIAILETARRGVEALVNIIAAGIDIFVSAGKAAKEFAISLTPVSYLAKLTGREVKTAQEIMAEFTAETSAAVSAAKTGVGDAIRNLSDTFTALFNPAVEEATEKANEVKGAIAGMSSGADEAAGAIRVAGDASREMARELEQSRRDTERYREEMIRLEEQALELANGLLAAGEDARAWLSGPAEEAALRYRRKLEEIDETLRKIAEQGVLTADVIAAAEAVKERAAEEYRQELERISEEQRRAAEEAQEAARRAETGWVGALNAMRQALEAWRSGGIRSFADFVETVKRLFSGLGKAIKNALADNIGDAIAGALEFAATVRDQRRGGRDTAGSIAATISQAMARSGIPIVQQIGRALNAIDSIFGGRLFGTGWQPSSSGVNIAFGEGGVTGSQYERQVRQRSFFRGRQWRTQTSALDPSTLEQLRRAFDEISQVVAQAARALRVEAPAMIEGAFSEVRDAQGRVVSQTSTVLGRTFQESFEQFTRRVTAENLLAVIDRALGSAVVRAAEQVGDDLGDAIGGAIAPIGREFGSLTKSLEAAGVSASQIAERWRGNADQLLDGAQMMLAAVIDMRDGVRILGGTETLGALVDLVEGVRQSGESLVDAYSRVAQSVRLLDEALAMSGVAIDRTREEIVRFAVEIADAAGGIERATRLWSDYFEMFYSAEERAQAALARAQAAAGRELGDIGLELGDFAGAEGMRAFRQMFEALLPTLTPEQVAQWLEAAQALGTLNRMLAEMAGEGGGGAEDAAEALRALLDEVLSRSQEVLSFAEQIAALDELFAGYIARATELGASEEQLALIRAQHAREIEALMQAEAEAAAARERAAASLRDYLAVLEAEASGGVTALTTRMRQLQAQYQAHIERIEELARASGRAGASSAELALAHRWYAAQVQRVVSEMLAQAQNIISRLYGSVRAAGAGDVGTGGSWVGGGGGGEVGAIGAVQSAMEERYQREMQLLDRIREFLESLDTSQLSPLTPAERLAAARRAYEDALARAQAGDLDALEQLPRLAQEYLGEARSFTGGVGGYRQLFEQVQAALRALANRGALSEPGGQTGGVGGGGGGGVVVEAGSSFRELSELERFSLATELTTLLRDLLPALGLDLASFAERFGLDLRQYLEDLGVTLDDMSVETALRLADIARALGIELTDLANAVGVSLGELGDRQSLLNDALERVIAGLPEEYRAEIEGYLLAIEQATTEADARAAIARAEAAIREMPPWIADLLAPFFEGVASPTDMLLMATLQQTEVLVGIYTLLAEFLEGRESDAPGGDYSKAVALPTMGAVADIDGGSGSLVAEVIELRSELRALRAEQREQAERQDRILAEQLSETRRAALVASRRSAA